ncbi:MAG: hypothetical protein IPL39_06165 [Opitutaceae bacterium]|nr:hypothetical protein [Opitutaceae bacterium]
MLFFIQFTDRRKRLARLQAGSFSEAFRVQGAASTTAVEAVWLRELAALLGRKKKVVLPVVSEADSVSRAWVVYRLDDKAMIQDRQFPAGFDPEKGRIPEHESVTADGERIAEWPVRLADIADFLRRKAGPAKATSGSPRRTAKPGA